MTRPVRLPHALTPELLITAYAHGAFPMARGRDSDEIHWFSPDPRAICPLDAFHCPRSVRRLVRQRRFEIRHDSAFAEVVDRCAQPRPAGESETWINHAIRDVFCRLHEMGLAHSIETWQGGELVGGLYGLALGGAFFGESMYHHPGRGSGASNVALVKTVEHLKTRGFTLFDVQFSSPHLERFGVTEIRRDQYMVRLADALEQPVTWSDA